LSYSLRIELIERTCYFVKGRVPVLAGITDSDFSESLNLARVAAESGADAVKNLLKELDYLKLM